MEAIAKFDFMASGEDELGFHAGDVLKVGDMGPRRASDNHQDQGAVPGRWAQERELRERGFSETPGKNAQFRAGPCWGGGGR